MKQLIIVTVFSMALFTSCKRDFDEPNPNQPTIESFWKTSEDAVKGVNAEYSIFHRGSRGIPAPCFFMAC